MLRVTEEQLGEIQGRVQAGLFGDAPVKRKGAPKDDPEARLQRAIVRQLRPLVEAAGGTLLALNIEVTAGTKWARNMQLKRLAMGAVPGITDLMVVSAAGLAHWIELKAPGGERKLRVRGTRLVAAKTAPGRMSEPQEQFQATCTDRGWPHAVCRSVEECRAVLVEWRLIAARAA